MGVLGVEGLPGSHLMWLLGFGFGSFVLPLRSSFHLLGLAFSTIDPLGMLLCIPFLME